MLRINKRLELQILLNKKNKYYDNITQYKHTNFLIT